MNEKTVSSTSTIARGVELKSSYRVSNYYTLALFCSALGRLLGRRYFTYQHSSPDAVDQVNDVPALYWEAIMGFPFTLGYLHIQVDLPSALALVAQFSRLCSRWFLTHWRYPHPSRSVVSPAVALYSALLADRLPRPLPAAGWLYVLVSLLSFSNFKYSESPKLPRLHKKTRQFLSMPSLNLEVIH